jgi:hypothetical protein
MWEAERAAHTSARLSPSQRLPVYLNSIEPPSRVTSSALAALSAAALAAKDPQPRKREFAADKGWKWLPRQLGTDPRRDLAAVPLGDHTLLRRSGGPACDNQELRRVALERMGWERFLATANAQV